MGILHVNLKVLLFFHWDFVTPEPRFVGVKMYALLKQGFRDYTVFLNKLCSIFLANYAHKISKYARIMRIAQYFFAKNFDCFNLLTLLVRAF